MHEGNTVSQLEQSEVGKMHVMKCKRCGEELAFEVPQFEVINSLTISALVFAHPTFQRCPHCRQAYQMVVGGCKGVSFGFQSIKDPDTPNVVVASSIPSNLPKM